MVDSYSKEQLGRQLVKLALSKLDYWTLRELGSYERNDVKILLLPIGKKSWLVGNHKIFYKKNGSYSVIKDKKNVHDFRFKKAAFFYAILEKKHKFQISNAILQNDQLLGRLLEEQAFVTERLKLYRKKDNIFKEQLLSAKLGELENKLKNTKKELEKNLTLAKYVKVWD